MDNIISPDFIIAGAQKSGTTAISSILNQHPKISVSIPKEPMFFCRDDVSLHSCFFIERSGEWSRFDWKKNKDVLLASYGNSFRKESSHVLYGEASTTYMPSRRAAERIASLRPDAKIIFILRNPVDRAYSAYWHHVYKGTVSRTLRNQLRFDSHGILRFGLYKEYIESYLELFPKDQLYFEVFEEFKSDKQACINKILRFLNVQGEIEIVSTTERTNRARVPVFHRSQLILNEFKKIIGARYSAEDQHDVTANMDVSFICKYLIRVINKISSHNFRRTKYKKNDNELRTLLQEYYSRENDNLSELIGIDVGRYWWTN